VAEGIPVLLRKALDEIPVVLSLPVPYASHIEKDQLRATYLRMLPRAMRLAADSRLGLVLLHWPIPHPPGMYNRMAGDAHWQ
jgi:hypothetical protein